MALTHWLTGRRLVRTVVQAATPVALLLATMASSQLVRGASLLSPCPLCRGGAGNSARSKKSGGTYLGKAGSSLKGHAKVSCKPYCLAGVSLSCTAADVSAYCLQRDVCITGCYLLHSRVWGTQSAKIFIESSADDKVLRDSFWPEFIRCRPWEKHPPQSNPRPADQEEPGMRLDSYP